LSAARLPLATTEAVVIASLESLCRSFLTLLFDSYDRRIPSSGLIFVTPGGNGSAGRRFGVEGIYRAGPEPM
jgi:hypothetical protein